MHRRITQASAVIMMLALLITGCTSQASNIGVAKGKTNNPVDTGFTVNTVGSYDSADTAVVVSVDIDNNAVTFLNMDAGRQYTLYYDGTTYVKDKYSGSMAISQIKAGDVVDVNFLKGKRQIASIQLSPNSWVYDSIGNYNLGGINKTASIGSTTYSLPDDVAVFSGGKRAEVMDIVSQDVISVRGIDHKIYSINVERGHGYLRLKNDQALIGGWIEVGNAVIREISEDMLLIVPEGSYQVLLSNNGSSCIKDIIVERDKEVILDVGDLEIVQDKMGMILLSVTPEDAQVKIDGKEVDISNAIELPYGIHQVYLEADGYDSLTKYIQVGSEYAKISFSLEKQKERTEDDSSISQNDLTGSEPEEDNSSISDNTLSAFSSNRVYIDAPQDVEVYLDGNYIGISPVSFKKTVGSHSITLRKSGYVTKSYTIYLYGDGEDITYSFTDLEKESTSSNTASSTSSKSTATGNTTSSSTSTGNNGSQSENTISSADSSQTPEPDEDGDGKGDDNNKKDDDGENTDDGDDSNTGDGDNKGENGNGENDDDDTGDGGEGDNTENGDNNGDETISPNSLISSLFRKK